MSGSADDVSFLHNHFFIHVPSSFQTGDTNIDAPVWAPWNEPFQNLPLHFQMNEVSPKIDATAPKNNNGSETPSSAVVFGVSERTDDPNADLGATNQMPKRRKKINSKVASGRNDAKKLKAGKLEKELGYVHVRARRGQATDSHSLAERARREKIGERMKLLQSLVPGCDKIAGKAQVLDEIINYVQSLQTQVQILVGKLSILSPNVSGYDINQGITTPARTESICRLEASLSTMMMESSSNLLHFSNDSQHNSLVSASSSSSSSSLTSQAGDQKYFTSQGVDVPLWEKDVQGHLCALDQFWLDHLVQYG